MSLKILLPALAALVLLPSLSYAERVRYHFVPSPDGTTVALRPSPTGAPGERLTLFGGNAEPFPRELRATHVVTFRHPATSRNVNVPLRLPDSTPRVEYGPNRISFNYGSYLIEVFFLADGSLDVTY